MIVKAIGKLINAQHLSIDETVQVFEQIMSGSATDAQIGAYLIAQRMCGEGIEEITGAATVMRAKATPIPTHRQELVDTCGTGGDSSGTFNISTASAFVAAGAGVPIAKHGNRSISSKCGSADVLNSLGLNLELNSNQVGQCIDDIGIGFLFAPMLHGAMKFAIGPRKEIGQRSIFNVLGPLTNPAGAKRQVMGVFDSGLTETLAEVLANLGADHVWVVHGLDGIDEISLCAVTKVSEYSHGMHNNFELDPRDYGFEFCQPKDLAGNTPDENAGIIRKIFEGELSPRRDIVILNAAAAILTSGLASSFEEGLEAATKSIDEGQALKKLKDLITKTNSFGN